MIHEPSKEAPKKEVHVRIDSEAENSKRKFACGIGPALPEGHVWFGATEFGCHHLVNCPECARQFNVKPLGTPMSQISGRPGRQGYEEFKRIAASWGHD
jgi:hypothetical protein